MIIDANTIKELLIAMSWVTPVLIALVGVIRVSFNISDRWVPLTSLILGVGAGFLVVGLTVLGGVAGAVIGLTASGLYDVGKKSVLGA